jgi:hypothetical protein
MAQIRVPVEELPPPDKNGDHAFQFRIISIDKNQRSTWSQLYIIKSIGQYRPLESNVVPDVSSENVGLTWDTPIIYNNSASLSSASISHNHSQDFKQHDTDIFVQWNSGSTMGNFEYSGRVSEDFTSVSIPISSYNKVSELLPLDLEPIDQYGSVISISEDGNTAIIGASFGSSSVNSFNGTAYVFVRSGTTWTQQAKLVASDPEFFDNFGSSVSISADGNTALIGAVNEDTSPNTANGAVYVFVRSGTTWTQQAKLLASDAAKDDNFGSSVSISADGNTALIGAVNEDTSPNTNNGAVYVFVRSGTTWTQQAKLLASDAASGDNFGSSVSISANGNTAIIGSPFEDTSPNINNGAVYAFTRSDTTWTQRQKIVPEDAKSNDFFGKLVSISGDGSTFVVSSNIGFVYVYALSANTWRQQARLFSTENFLNYNFGSDISISEDGNTIAVGAYVTGSGGSFYTLGLGAVAAAVSTESGGCHIFTRLNFDWTQKFRIVDTLLNSKNFGRAASISGDGTTLLLGIPTTDENNINGNANIYNLSNANKFRAIGTVALKDIPKNQTLDNFNNTEKYLLSLKEYLFGSSDLYGPENPSSDSVYGLFKIFDTGIINV